MIITHSHKKIAENRQAKLNLFSAILLYIQPERRSQIWLVLLTSQKIPLIRQSIRIWLVGFSPPASSPLCRLPVWGYRAVAWFITSCAGVNAAIDKSSACKISVKRSAFAFARCKKLCIWRHLLLLSAVIHESHSPIPPDWPQTYTG